MADTPFEGLSNETLRNARDISDSMSDISSAASRLGRELEGVDGYTSGINTKFSQIRRSADKVADIQEEARKSAKGTAKALDEQAKNLSRVRQLNLAIDKLFSAANNHTGETRDNLLRQAQNLSNARDNAKGLAEYYGKIADDAARLDKGSSAFDTMGQIASKYFGSNFAKPFQAASDAARQQALDNAKIAVERQNLDKIIAKGGKGLTKAKLEELKLTRITGKTAGIAANEKLKKYRGALKTQTTLSAGFKAMGPVITKALGPLAWIKLAADAIKFFVSLFIDANKQAVDLARAMGTSVTSADVMRERFRDIRTLTGTTRNNIQNLVDAQKELNAEFQGAFVASNETLDSQTFLTKRLNLNAQEAAKLNIRFEGIGENAYNSTNSIIEMSQAFADANGYAVPLDMILKSTSEASGQIAASFGFSNKAIARGVLQVRKFGLNLSQAEGIAKSLLNFENSIGAELEAELLTGKNLEFNRARVLAATGDIAGATSEVMKQMEGLTEEQRRSPIIMESVAKTTGLSVDALQDAFLIQQNNNKAAQKYEEILRSGNEQQIKQWRAQSGLEQATRKEIEARVTLGEQFQEAMDDVKQQFVGLVDGGYIQILVDAIKAFANEVDYYTGTSKRLGKEGAEKIARSNVSEEEKARAAKLVEMGKGPSFLRQLIAYGGGGIQGALAMAQEKSISQIANRELHRMGKKVDVNDFTIRTHPKDTLVMAGGTKLGEDNKKTNQLLERLISAVEKGGNVYIDGNAAGKSMVLGTYTSS